MGWLLIHIEGELPSSLSITDSELLSANNVCLYAYKDVEESDPFFRFAKKIQPCVKAIVDMDEE